MMMAQEFMPERRLLPAEQISKKAEEILMTVPVLGITIGEGRWLVPMSNISEILPVPRVTPVFLTQPWFLGVINVRGNIYGLCDLSSYLDDMPTYASTKNRVFLIAPRLGSGYAVLTGSILGIRNLMEFTRQPDHEGKRRVVAGLYNDRQGRLWRMLNLPALVQLESFLQASS